MNRWQLAGIGFAMLFIWFQVSARRGLLDFDPEVEEEGVWMPPEIAPAQPGLYRSRVPGKPHTESLSTLWTGVKWTYTDGSECYQQDREWKPLTDADAERTVA